MELSNSSSAAPALTGGPWRPSQMLLWPANRSAICVQMTGIVVRVSPHWLAKTTGIPRSWATFSGMAAESRASRPLRAKTPDAVINHPGNPRAPAPRLERLAEQNVGARHVRRHVHGLGTHLDRGGDDFHGGSPRRPWDAEPDRGNLT